MKNGRQHALDPTLWRKKKLGKLEITKDHEKGTEKRINLSHSRAIIESAFSEKK